MDMCLTKPVSAEQPCGPDPEYDPEYLLLFSRAAPQAEAQYGDFVSTPEAVNWPADALAPESVRQQLADLEARGALPLAAFREAQESAERLQVWARETLGNLAPDFSRLRQLLALLPDVVQTTTPEIPPSPAPAPDPAGTVMDNAVPARAEDVPPVNTPPGISLPHNAEPGPIRDRNDALERLRCIRRWFESSEPSSPTIPLLRQAERLVGKRFSEVINEIPVELLEKWDALE
ncbi:hypothetical protein HZ405_001709 [Salmonella enterica]|nr:hypothetical protein [Salmonella enterica]EAN1800999.1 hypothetical protein [Salmonella enterica]EAO3352757.1 hypothetical protein [Salmonella enterica]EAT1328471.1 hypothetical protein [Salmonella enterica]EAT9514111.1 hypothetical protein [Salmonella enterica]